MAEEVQSITGRSVWEKFKGQIPGTTRVPGNELKELLGKAKGKVGLDLGCGSGRSTAVLKKELNCELVALDLSLPGLKTVESTKKRVLARGEALPFENATFDFVNVCGVMTNLTDRDPQKAQAMRDNLAQEAFRCLKKGGVLVVSDFSARHALSGYPVNYDRHKLITGERGTIAVFDPKAKITFEGLTNEEVKQLGHSEHLERFAHHYLPEELISIFQNAGFQALKYTIEIRQTPSRTPIDTIILAAVKPQPKPISP